MHFENIQLLILRSLELLPQVIVYELSWWQA